MDRRVTKILTIAVCMLLAVTGLFFQIRRFLAGEKEEKAAINLENPEAVEEIGLDEGDFIQNMEVWAASEGIRTDHVLIAAKEIETETGKIQIYLSGEDRNYQAIYDMKAEEYDFKIIERK